MEIDGWVAVGARATLPPHGAALTQETDRSSSKSSPDTRQSSLRGSILPVTFWEPKKKVPLFIKVAGIMDINKTVFTDIYTAP